MEIDQLISGMGRKARDAALALAGMDSAEKSAGLRSVADSIESRMQIILDANSKDLEAAAAGGLSAASMDRLKLDPARVSRMADGVRSVATLPDPVGTSLRKWALPNGLEIDKLRTPIGVVGIIYESRPNVTSDAASLCLRTGNAVILRGGSESIESNRAIADAIFEGATAGGFPPHSVQLVPVTDRGAVRELCRMDGFLDVIIPRGGHALIRAVVEQARMPVVKHYHGVCAVYVDRGADLAMASKIAVNSKCQRPGVCNAMETLLVHRAVLEAFLHSVVPALNEFRVKFHADADSAAALRPLGAEVIPAVDGDWSTEYLDFELAIKVVDSVEEAISHINRHGSHHSDAIVTGDRLAADLFLRDVDSAAVYWNASTRFTDGGEFGFGAEIGISTDKLPCRGPMGLEELTTYKYVVRGDGQIRP